MQNVSKRTFLWIVPILIIIIFWYFYGPKKEITDNEYITYIKETSLHEDKKETIEQSLANYCEEEKWIYFKTQKNHNVVEFKGSCPVEGKTKHVNLQFVVEDNQKGYKLGALLLDGDEQSQSTKDKFLNSVVSK